MAEIVYPSWISNVGPVEELASQLDGVTIVNGGGEVVDRSPEDIVALIVQGYNWMDYCAWPLYYQEHEALFAWGFARLLQALGVPVDLVTLASMFDFWGPGELAGVDEQGREIRYLNVYSPIPLPEGLGFRVDGIYHEMIPPGSYSIFALESAAGGYYYGSWNVAPADYIALGVSAGHEVDWRVLLPQIVGAGMGLAMLGMVGGMAIKTFRKGGS